MEWLRSSANNGAPTMDNGDPAISADGRFVAFLSYVATADWPASPSLAPDLFDGDLGQVAVWD